MGGGPRMRFKGMVLIFFIFIAMIILLDIFYSLSQGTVATLVEPEKEEPILPYEENPLNDLKLYDNTDIYHQDDDTHIYELYVTILPPQNGSLTFNELNVYYNQPNYDDSLDIEDPFVEAYFEQVKPTGKDLPHSPNATMKIRGQSSRLARVKSYKIKLFDTTEPWDGFDIINLNKHYGDKLKIVNKFCYDYFELIPDFVSMRTRFVKLYVRDLSSAKDSSFVNYGLYTFIEQPNKNFLRTHGLDVNAHLYKAEYFEFYRYASHIKSKEDMTFDSDRFNQVLDAKGNDNHEKIIKMLDAVNDYSLDINEVVDQYFDRDNLYTWLAVNILLNNIDTNSRNFILYSPLNSDIWFFIPWDYDGSLRDPYNSKWQRSIANYWGMVLFERLFKDPDNIYELSQKIEELSEIINEENTKKLLNSYFNTVINTLQSHPDNQYMRDTKAEYKQELFSIINKIEVNRQDYYVSLENPLPFFMGEPEQMDGEYHFVWEASYDFQGDDLTYHFALSTDPDFNHLLVNQENIKSTQYVIPNLNPGNYFWKVTVYDSKGNSMDAFDYIRLNDVIKYGVKSFNID